MSVCKVYLGIERNDFVTALESGASGLKNTIGKNLKTRQIHILWKISFENWLLLHWAYGVSHQNKRTIIGVNKLTSELSKKHLHKVSAHDLLKQ